MKQFMNFYNKENQKVGYIEFKNISYDVGEIYIYGQIMSGSEKWDDSDVTVKEFKEKLDNLGNVKTLDIYVNSPGGSVTSGVNILNILNRHRATKNVYIDALAASITSVIITCYDNLYIYPTSTVMIHEAMMGIFFAMLNKTELTEMAEQLERIEENMIIPAYMQKASDQVSEEMIRDAMKKETWWGAKEIQKYFNNVTLIEEEKDIAACANFDVLNKYQNVPERFKSLFNFKNNKNKDANNQIDNNSISKQKLKLELELL